jgi:hypothetical protein
VPVVAVKFIMSSNYFLFHSTSTCSYSGLVVAWSSRQSPGISDAGPGRVISVQSASVDFTTDLDKVQRSQSQVARLSFRLFKSFASSFENFHSACSTMSSISASFILSENVRLSPALVLLNMPSRAAVSHPRHSFSVPFEQRCRSDRSSSSVQQGDIGELWRSAFCQLQGNCSQMPYCCPLPHKTSFGFIPGGAPRTPEERGVCAKNVSHSFAGVARTRAKYLPKFKLGRAPTNSCDAQYTREYVCQNADSHRILPIPALLVSPATHFGGQVLDPDMFIVVPEIREHAPPKWDEWHPTRHPEDDVRQLTCRSSLPPQ